MVGKALVGLASVELWIEAAALFADVLDGPLAVQAVLGALAAKTDPQAGGPEMLSAEPQQQPSGTRGGRSGAWNPGQGCPSKAKGRPTGHWRK